MNHFGHLDLPYATSKDIMEVCNIPHAATFSRARVRLALNPDPDISPNRKTQAFRIKDANEFVNKFLQQKAHLEETGQTLSQVLAQLERVREEQYKTTVALKKFPPEAAVAKIQEFETLLVKMGKHLVKLDSLINELDKAVIRHEHRLTTLETSTND